MLEFQCESCGKRNRIPLTEQEAEEEWERACAEACEQGRILTSRLISSTEVSITDKAECAECGHPSPYTWEEASKIPPEKVVVNNVWKIR